MGRVYIVGAGPGDPELITVKGARILSQADAVVYDRLVSRELLELAPGRALRIYVGKEPGRHSFSQEEINRLLEELSRKLDNVVRLKGGDPYVFGRGEEECQYLISRGVECRVVPGVPSFVAASAYAGIPLTSRGVASSFAVATGREADGKPRRFVNLRALARAVDVVVVLMGVGELPRIAAEVASARSTRLPAAVVVDASLESQKTLTTTAGTLARVGSLESYPIRSPAVVFFGETVRMRDKLWRTGAEYSI